MQRQSLSFLPELQGRPHLVCPCCCALLFVPGSWLVEQRPHQRCNTPERAGLRRRYIRPAIFSPACWRWHFALCFVFTAHTPTHSHTSYCLYTDVLTHGNRHIWSSIELTVLNILIKLTTFSRESWKPSMTERLHIHIHWGIFWSASVGKWPTESTVLY